VERSIMRARHPNALLVLALGLLAALAVGCQSDDPTGPPTTSSRQPNTGGCALPSLTCADVCRDLTSDRAHCGACNRACGATEVCSRGSCAASCGLGLSRCATDGSCHDLRSDPAHCGTCGHACGFGEVCNQGACAPSCASHLTACGSGACRDVMTDPYNCGACGRACTAGEVCTSGACALPAVCALGGASNTTAVVDQAELVSSATTAARVGLTRATGAGQRFTVGRTGFLSGVEVSLTTCGGALLAGSTVQLAVLDERGQTLATATLPSTAVTNGACPRFPPSLTTTARTRAIFDLGASCVPVTAGRRLHFVVTATGATTTGTCPNSTRRCSNAPTVACTAAAQCAGLPAIVSAGVNPLSTYAGGLHTIGDTDVPGAALTFKTHVTPFVTWCAGETSCNGTCRDLTTDRNHCGACGRSCSSSLVCSGGACQTVCGAGLSTCTRGGVAYCANLRSDNVNCGACGVACAPGQVCAAGGCVATCGVGMTTCGRGATAYCANPATDNANCGRCGNVCPAGQACASGACASSCGAPTTRCGAVCVDTRYDPANCGACGNACPAGQVCSAGVCGGACGAGLTTCGAGALTRCADLQNDPTSCGACGRACPAGQLCAAGACGVACGADSVRCDLGAGPYCAAPLADNANCGGCGVRCGAGNACIDGACAVTCGPDQGTCSGRCVDMQHDPAHCGDCGRACAAGQYCTMGSCATACAAPDTLCGGRCVDLRSNPDHCGACGGVCPAVGAGAIRACGDATCGSFCNPGRGDCDGASANGCETDLRVTAAHCGLCGRACALPHATSGCATGACAVTACDAGWVDCNGDPSDGCELRDGAACAPTAACAVGALRCYEGQSFCQPELVSPAGQVCRSAVGPCDVAEACDGMSPLCPSDRVVPAPACPSGLSGGGTTSAGDDTGCLATYTFRVERGHTYTVSTCGSFTGDPLVRVAGACRCANDDACELGARCTCTATEDGEATICAASFPGLAASWSCTVTTSAGRCGAPTPCRLATGVCDAEEVCDGVAPTCPVDAPKPEGAACEDGDFCTRGDTCRASVCAPGAALSCAEGQCQGAFCDRATGRCVAKSDGTTCDDTDATTSNDVCYAGACVGHGGAAAQVASGFLTSLIRTADGRVWSFGRDLLTGADNDRFEVHRVPARVPGLANVSAVSLGVSHALAIHGMGVVSAWGENGTGQLGDGTTAARAAPVVVAGLPPIARVAAGWNFSLALAGDGTLWSWGSDARGQLGQGATTSTSPTPVRVVSLPTMAITAIAAGGGHALALMSDGSVWAWGDNAEGQLGDGTTTSRSASVRVVGLTSVTAIAAGTAHSLALRADGTVWAWGKNTSGQLGDGTTAPRLIAQRVAGLPSVTAVAAGYAHSVARAVDGSLWGFGDSGQGQLATGPEAPLGTPSPHPTAARVGSLAGVSDVAAGIDHTLAVTTDGRVWAFGGNEVGQLGDDGVGTTARPRVDTVVGFGRHATLVLEQGYNTHRTGANTRETALTTANVRPTTFGRLPGFNAPVDGQVHAQPLFVGGAINGRDALYVATERNTLYALDASTGAVIWSRNYGVPFDQVAPRAGFVPCSSSINPVAGITSTPALDLSTHTIYFVAKRDTGDDPAAPSNGAAFELHAVDMFSGAERAGSPVRIEATITRSDVRASESLPVSSGRSLVFDPLRHYQRPALLLQDGQLWVAFGGTCDILPYHGWVMTYDARTLARSGAWVSSSVGDPACVMSSPTCVPGTAGNPGTSTCCASGAGIWASGRGPASRGTGDVYVTTGNTFVPHAPDGVDMSNAVVRLGRGASGDVTVRDWYVPWNWRSLDEHDSDLSSAGVTLIPGTNLLLATGKSADF